MIFVVLGPSERVPAGGRPMVVLRRNTWNDFGFETLFDAELRRTNTDAVPLGGVKIMRLGQESGPTPLPSQFEELPDSYCSLGQDIDYYEYLRSLPAEVRRPYLAAMRDAAADPGISARFGGEDAWQTSLLRFGQATHALEAGAELLRGERRTFGRASFVYVRPDDSSELRIQFKFDDRSALPGRCNVVIGYNGAGKTTLLADIARAASQVGKERSRSRLVGSDTTFGAVIAVSYSAFDNFELPTFQAGPRTFLPGDDRTTSTESFGYAYCGLRRLGPTGPIISRQELKNLDEIDQEFLSAMTSLLERDQASRSAMEDALNTVEQEPSFGRIGVRPSSWISDPSLASGQVKRLSTGHKIVLNIIVQLAAHLRRRSLVLLDEPETHLHPPLLAALLKAIQRLLDVHDSFAIVATHSPVVLQEVPSSFVHVMSRFGDITRVSQPEIETFGENIGSITRHVFFLDSSGTDYQGVLRTMVATMSLDEIEAQFPLGLSAQARAFVLRLQHELP